MVASASSSKTKWPSGRCNAQSAFVAEAIESSNWESMLLGAGCGKKAFSLVVVIQFYFRLPRLRSRARQPRRLISRSDRTLDGGREASRRPVAGEKEISPAGPRSRPVCILFRKRGKGGAALPDDVPRWQDRGQVRQPYHVIPDILCEHLAGGLNPPVRGTYGGRNPVGKGEQPFRCPIDNACNGRKRFRGLSFEMHVDDGTEVLRRRQLRQEQWGNRGGHREDHGINRGKAN